MNKTVSKGHISPHNKAISQHIFMFPFTVSTYVDNVPISTPRQIQKLFDELCSSDWNPEPFKVFESREEETEPEKGTEPEDCFNYDEYSYFHEYIRKTLFTFKTDVQDSSWNFSEDTDAVSYFFRYPLVVPATFRIDIVSKLDDCGQPVEGYRNSYSLTIKGITLRLFKTGVVILCFELHNHSYNQLEDILRINDFGRRVYPQFMEASTLKVPKEKFLADAITIELKDKLIEESFDFEYFRFSTDQERILKVGRHIVDLFGETFSKQYYITPIIDDRMFTLCWYANDELVQRLIAKSGFSNRENENKYPYRRAKQSDSGIPEGEYCFESAEEWFRFVFIDGQGCSCPEDKMRRELVAASTYRRWAPFGTLYGVSRYSLMCLTTAWDGSEFLREHMRRHYRQMSELVLAQRASMIVFSSRISEISGRIDDLRSTDNKRQEISSINDEIRTLQGDYIGFVNRLWFDEITPQEQGIEIYDMAIKNMRLKEQMQELKEEIRELYEFMEMQEANSINDTMLKLNQIATYAVPISLVLAFWGISEGFVQMIDFRRSFSSDQGWYWVGGSIVMSFIFARFIVGGFVSFFRNLFK